jgi:four helix bundle protein
MAPHMHNVHDVARDVRALEVFRLADTLMLEVMAICATFSRPEHFTICDQLRRAALSVPTNLVEGAQRDTTREFGRFVEIAVGSAAETRYLLSVLARLEPSAERPARLATEYEMLVRRLQALRTRMAGLVDSPGQLTKSVKPSKT